MAWRTLLIAAVGVVGMIPAVAGADTILKRVGPLAGVKVTGIQGDDLAFTTASGDPRTAALADVQKLTIDGQPAFNAAEDAYLARDFAAALDDYRSALSDGGSPAWLRTRAAERLATVARVRHRYDAQITAYAALLAVAPGAAAAARPAAPTPNDPDLDAATANLNRALSSASASQRPALLAVRLDIERARGDRSAVTETLRQLVAAGGATPAVQATLKLSTAQDEVDANQFARAESDIVQNRGLFTDPAQQVEALFVLARARDGLAAAGGGADGLKDAALSYMRVVTFGADLPDRPHVADALLRAAEIEEKLGDGKGALSLYQQLAGDRAYAGTPAAANARAAVDRLKK